MNIEEKYIHNIVMFIDLQKNHITPLKKLKQYGIRAISYMFIELMQTGKDFFLLVQQNHIFYIATNI